MNLKKLEIFYYAAKSGSFTTAAGKLLISQPAVSIQVRELEKYYNVKLFKRSGKNLQLTKTGKILFSYAEKIFELVKSAENELFHLGNFFRNTLRIGATQTCAKYILVPSISTFQAQNPEVKIAVRVGNPNKIIDSVIDLENELAVVPSHKGYSRELSSLFLKKEEIFLVVSNSHKWFDRRTEVKIEELRNERIIFYGKDGPIGSNVLKVFKKYDFNPDIELSYEGEGLEFIKEIVILKKYVSFLTRLPIKNELEQGILKPLRLSSERIFMDLRIYYKDNDLLSSLAKQFLQTLTAERANLP
ncbi:MAG: LysR family transcriptional regulator [Deltaproteobacteria bacterium]|nr:LysR family transcriptional regulator [Deltaproteobacteria bacterium]